MIEDHDLDEPVPNRCIWCGMPLTPLGCYACIKPQDTRPSRQFMIQQAVLTAAGSRYPCAVREHRLAGALSFLTVGGHMPVHDQLLDDIRAEFHKIAARYA